MTNPSRSQRIQGGIWGLLVGDALGVPYEFHLPAEIPPPDQIEFEPPTNFLRAHQGVPAGTWSDDGAHALCLMASLLHCKRLDTDDLMRRLNDWYENGYMAVDGKVFDVGVQTARALSSFRSGTPAIDAGPSDVHDNGNGSLMRVLPLALWHQGTDTALATDAQLQSRVTHGHLRAQVCCALYCVWARNILNEVQNPWESAVQFLRELYDEGSAEQAELEFNIRPDDEPIGQGSGYVVDSLRSARFALKNGDFESVMRSAIRLGRDTDTTACIAGGISGLIVGLEGIPQRWQDGLRDRELFLPMLEQLILTSQVQPQ